MPTAVRRTKLVHVDNQPRRYRLPILAAALAAAGLLSLGQARATVIEDFDSNEPTNNDVTGATLTSSLSNTFQGCVGARCLASINPSTVPTLYIDCLFCLFFLVLLVSLVFCCFPSR